MRRKSFLGTLLFTISLLLSACGTSGGNNGGKNKLQLLYFGRATNNVQLNNRLVKLPNRLDEEPAERHYDVRFYEGVELEAHVKNVDRLAFLDIVVYSQSTGKKYVFNDGNGDYRVEASTVLNDDMWVTKIRFSDIWGAINIPNETCVLDTYLEIEEINFLNLSGSVAKTDINNGDIKKVSLHAIADEWDEERHQWTPWVHKDKTCDQWAGQYRYCQVCNLESVQMEGEPPTGHVYNGEWRLETSSPTAIRKGDKLIAVDGVCSACQQLPTVTLPMFYTKLDLVIPNGIVEIGDGAFAEGRGLKSVTIPSSVTSIGYQAFAWTENMKKVYFESEVPPTIGGDVFAGTWDYDDFKIYVPLGSAEAYKAVTTELWKEYAVRHIFEYEKENSGCIDGNGHNIENWTFTEQVTCTKDGKKSGDCSKCGKHFDAVVPATGHAYTEQTISGADGQVSYRQKTCANCGAVELAIRAIDGTLAEGTTIKAGIPADFVKLSKPDQSISYSFNYDGQARSAKLYQYAVADGWNSVNPSYSYYGRVDSGDKANFSVSFNDTLVDISSMKGVSYQEMFMDGEDILGDYQYSPIANCLIGDVTIKNGTNSFTYTRLDSYGLCIKDFVIVME